MRWILLGHIIFIRGQLILIIVFIMFYTEREKSSLTGFPVSSSNTMKERPKEMRRDFLQITPLSKQSTFSAVTVIIASNEL